MSSDDSDTHDITFFVDKTRIDHLERKKETKEDDLMHSGQFLDNNKDTQNESSNEKEKKKKKKKNKKKKKKQKKKNKNKKKEISIDNSSDEPLLADNTSNLLATEWIEQNLHTSTGGKEIKEKEKLHDKREKWENKQVKTEKRKRKEEKRISKKRRREAEIAEAEAEGLLRTTGENTLKYKRGKDFGEEKGDDELKPDKDVVHFDVARQEKHISYSRQMAKATEVWNTEESGGIETHDEMLPTWKLTQNDIKQAVNLQGQDQIFNLVLKGRAPYKIDFSRNGRYMLLGGRKGHVASFDWISNKLLFEITLPQVVRDIKYLHDFSLCAIAQKKFVYIYDDAGTEIHEMPGTGTVALDYLPYHWLLLRLSPYQLRYFDVSMGRPVRKVSIKHGTVLATNPTNAITLVGHQNGTVSMYNPNEAGYSVKALCHRGPIRSVVCYHDGIHMATAGLDGKVRLWDVRNLDRRLSSHHTSDQISDLAVSQKGMLAVATSKTTIVLNRDILFYDEETDGPLFRKVSNRGAKDLPVKYQYLRVPLAARDAIVESVEFAPFNDVLGIGHSWGVSSALVPGSGEPNIDTRAANPYETELMRKNKAVRDLMDKIQPDLISLEDTWIGKMMPVKPLSEEQLRKSKAINRKAKKTVSKGTKGAFTRKQTRRKAMLTWEAKRDHIRFEQEKILDRKKKKEEYNKGQMARKEFYKTLTRDERRKAEKMDLDEDKRRELEATLLHESHKIEKKTKSKYANALDRFENTHPTSRRS